MPNIFPSVGFASQHPRLWASEPLLEVGQGWGSDFLRSPCYGWVVLIINKFHCTLSTYIPACHSLVLPPGAIQNKSSPSFAQQPMCYSKKPSFFLQRLSYSRLGAKFEIAPHLSVQPWNSQLLRKLVLWLFFSSIPRCVASQIPQLVFFFFFIT